MKTDELKKQLAEVAMQATFASDREEDARIRAEIAAIGRLNPTTGRRNKIAQLRAQLPPMLRDDAQCVTMMKLRIRLQQIKAETEYQEARQEMTNNLKGDWGFRHSTWVLDRMARTEEVVCCFSVLNEIIGADTTLTNLLTELVAVREALTKRTIERYQHGARNTGFNAVIAAQFADATHDFIQSDLVAIIEYVKYLLTIKEAQP